MNELSRIPGAGVIQGVSGQEGARDGKPRLVRRRRKKKRPGDDPEDEAAAEERAMPPPVDGADGVEPEDEGRGRHVDVRA